MSDKRLTLGSLFDGSGGFPLAGALHGIEPIWASEVEPYPIAVTVSRFPNMKHLGDVSKINGAEIEPVDIITFGSPCQDLSVAGKREGIIAGERSSLFFQATRIIKEMRNATNNAYPNVIIWENVSGALNSHNGEDFRIAIEEIVNIFQEKASVPSVPKGGWAYADEWRGDDWSVAYRVLDAQYWGVPQRRKRIVLIGCAGAERAGKILFEPKGMSRNFEESRVSWEDIADIVKRGS